MLLIDAFNVLHLPDAVHQGRAIDMAHLAHLIGASRYVGRRAVLACDGAGDGSIDPPKSLRGRVRFAGIEVLFSGHDRSADDDIEARLRRGGGHGVVVVSDDRRLRRAAKRVRSQSLASGVFLAHLLHDEQRSGVRPVPQFARETPLDRYSVAHWMKVFGIAPGELLDRRAGQAVPESTPGKPAATPATRPESSHSPRPDRPKIADRASGVQAGNPHLKQTPSLPPATSDEHIPRLESLADDPVIREALKAWRGRLTLDDLDMARWLKEHPPGSGGDRRHG